MASGIHPSPPLSVGGHGASDGSGPPSYRSSSPSTDEDPKDVLKKNDSYYGDEKGLNDDKANKDIKPTSDLKHIPRVCAGAHIDPPPNSPPRRRHRRICCIVAFLVLVLICIAIIIPVVVKVR